MSEVTEKLLAKIKELPDEEKLNLVDAILTDLYKPDPDIERMWAEEARKRWAETEIDEAVSWYQEQSQDESLRFLTSWTEPSKS